MNDIHVTLSGNVTDDPRQFQLRDGSRVTSMRMAVNRRVLDQQTGTWQTRDTTFYTIRCYRGLADNVQQSVLKGQPIVVHGKLRIRQFEREGEQRFWAEVEAVSVGHDLRWGLAAFEKPARAYLTGAPADDERQELEDRTREWELTRALPLTPEPLQHPVQPSGHYGGQDTGQHTGDYVGRATGQDIGQGFGQDSGHGSSQDSGHGSSQDIGHGSSQGIGQEDGQEVGQEDAATSASYVGRGPDRMSATDFDRLFDAAPDNASEPDSETPLAA